MRCGGLIRWMAAALLMSGCTTSVDLGSREAACEFVGSHFQHRCAPKNSFSMQMEQDTLPILDIMSGANGTAYLIALPAGLGNMTPDVLIPHEMFAFIFPNGDVVPFSIFERANQSPVAVDEEKTKKYRGLLTREAENICFIGFRRKIENSDKWRKLCIEERRFDTARKVATGSESKDIAPMAFNSSTLLGMSVGETLFGDGVHVVLRHKIFDEMIAQVSGDKQERVIDISSRSTRREGFPSGIVDTKIANDGIYTVRLNFGALSETHQIEVSKHRVKIKPSEAAKARFSALSWQRDQSVSDTIATVRCFHSNWSREGMAEMENMCRKFLPIAREFGAPVEEIKSELYGIPGYSTVVSRYRMKNPEEIEKLKDAVLQAAPGTQYRSPQVEWFGPAGIGYCNKQECRSEERNLRGTQPIAER